MRAAVWIGIGALAGCGVNQTPQPTSNPQLPSCVPDRDGVITAEEVPVAFDLTAEYYVGQDSPVTLAGSDAWDLSEERASDDVVALGPVQLGTQWYAASFPGGVFVADAGGGLDSIFHQDDQGLWLHGTASHEPSPPEGKTLVRYVDPIAVLRFPMTDGTAFSAIGEIPDGVIDGLPFVGADQVDVEVAGEGRLDLPYVRFSPVLRVRTHVVRTPSTGTPTVSRRSTSFLFECFGEVAHADSKIDEPDADFTVAATLRRFALGVSGDQ